MGNLWDLIILRPITNLLIILSDFLFDSFGLAVIALTIIINLILLPLTLKQMKTTKATSELQPKLTALQKKYANDQQALAQEQMKLYKEAGISPSGCLLPMLVQMPVWVALYQAIMRVMAVYPETYLNLSSLIYKADIIINALPIKTTFLGMNLASANLLLAILVGLTMYLQQAMSTNPNASAGNPQAQQTTQMMQIMMPLMFIFLSMTLPAGLSIYWIINAIIRMVMQYFFSGWGGLIDVKDKIVGFFKGKKAAPVTSASKPATKKNTTPFKK